MAQQTMTLGQKPVTSAGVDPHKFSLWLFIVTVVMTFAAFISAYIVKKGEEPDFVVQMPAALYVSTVLLALSSGTMHWALKAAQRDALGQVKLGMGLTALLAGAFLFSQWTGWGQLVESNVYFSGDTPLASFMYVFTGVHAVHVTSAVIFLLVVTVSAFRLKVHSKSMKSMEMCATYWHFLDGLWIFIFIFLLYNN
ncbi:cytochrome oxidase subunit III [Fulvitalea axinellae]|uniref:Cytochrome oxidase subunit III n=1 Tax=Fulvitalea axinellae TaxID=1182444 RepID=A0AAU9DDD0_9BACT|nr:cytochrome oxidase subunit III [Fulvitalea axinellae]